MGLKWLFFPKTYKNRPRLGALPPDPHSLRRRLDPLCDTFEYTSLLNTSPKLDLHFPTISFRPFSLPKSWLSANGLQLQIFHSMISLPHKKFLFGKFLMTSMHAICSLGPVGIRLTPSFVITFFLGNSFL